MAGATTNVGSSHQIKSSGIPTNYGALSTLVTVFFFWGFIAAGNSVFIPFCKHYFNLDQFQSQLIDFAFYLAYYLGALGLFVYGAFGGKDLVAKWGYKKSIVYGLLFSAIGAVAMIIAVNANTFSGMLVGLFIVALGFSLQQTAAQPFAISLGDPATGTGRVNLGGGINSFGTAIGPLIVAFALFGTTAAITDEKIQALGLSKVIILYAGVGTLFIAAAAMFYFSKKVPAGVSNEETEKAGKALASLLIMTGLLIFMFVPVFRSYSSPEQQRIDTVTAEVAPISKQLDELKKSNPTSFDIATLETTIATKNDEINSIKHPMEQQRLLWLFGALAVVVLSLLFSNVRAKKNPDGWGAMKYPQLVLGMLGIFVYVGVEVSAVSNMGELLKQIDFGGYQSSEVAPFISMYWGGLMIGRLTGSISVFNFKSSTKQLLTAIVPLVAFGIVIAVITLSQYDPKPLYFFIVCVLVQIVAFYICKENPVRTLLIFATLGLTAMLIGIMSTGTVAIYAFMSGGLFCSIIWPAVFSLAIAGLGKYTTQGAAFLIMMILGGGIIPPIQGKIADFIQSKSSIPGFGIHQSYWVCVACFTYLALYAIIVKGILKKQGISFDTSAVQNEDIHISPEVA